MANGDSPEARAFLAEHIESFEELEVLSFLHDHRDTARTADEIAASIGLRGSIVETALAALRQRRLVDRSSEGRTQRHSLAALEPETMRGLVALVQTYRDDRLEILKLMNAIAFERIRNAAIRTFADAFVVGKGKKDG
jgi:DNA-binding transcriptional ArsR family regulator